MSAPASSHEVTRTALLEIYQILRAAALRARESRAVDPPAPAHEANTTDTAGSARPLGAGVRPTMHDDRAYPAKSVAAIEEDSHRDQLT